LARPSIIAAASSRPAAEHVRTPHVGHCSHRSERTPQPRQHIWRSRFPRRPVADDKSGDITRQTSEALAKVDDMLARAGTDKSRLLSVQIWLKSMDDFDAMNAVYDAWVVPGDAPTRACGKVELADPGYRIEVIATAARRR
jgi:enamine deaminase RidA (YjgF/YER057c/UK114 family)